MANIFKKPDVKPNKGKNGFDMSRRRQFTAPCGMLLPVFKDFANPGDKYKLNSDAFIRTEALQTAAFMRLKAHVDWFFVPITQLFSRWNEFFNGTNDVMSTAYAGHSGGVSSINPYQLPTFNVTEFITNFEEGNEGKGLFGTNNKLSSPGTGSNYGEFTPSLDEFGIPLAWNFRRLWDMLGYGSVSSYQLSADDEIGWNYCLLDFLAYHKIFHSHYRLTDWTPNNPFLYNIDYSAAGVTLTNSERVQYLQDILSTIHYRPYRKDYFSNILPQPIFGDSFASYIQNQFNNGGNLNSLINPELNSDSNVQSSGFYIVPDKASAVTSNITFDWSNGALLNVGSDSNSTYVGVSKYASAVGPNMPVKFNLSSDKVGNDLLPLGSSVGAADIRAMFALDKLLRVTAFAGGHYADQTLAHFGYEIPKGISDEAYYLGSQKTDININEVVATASTGVNGAGGTIGDIAGKAFGATAGSGDLDFTAPCHGFIMAIFSIEPEPDYASRGCETFNRYKESLDFYHPELDNVGMQPMYGVFNVVNQDPNSSQLNGWTYRYAELKSTFDVVNEGFWNTSKNDWVGFKQSIYGYRLNENGEYQDRVSTAPYSRQFYVMPQYTNTIFLQSVPFYNSSDTDLQYKYNEDAANGLHSFNGIPFNSANKVYSSDNFLITANFKCFKSSIMSVHSLPKML